MFQALDIATEATLAVFAATDGVAGYADLIDQARRAAASVALNLDEGTARTGGDRGYHFRVAYGSAREAKRAMLLLDRLGAVDGDEALVLLDRVAAMTWRLNRPRS